MNIHFDATNHVYAVDGDIAHVSITELLKKHGLSADYSKVNKATLAAAAETGKAIHKDCELVLNEPDYKPVTPEGEAFAEWVKENMSCGVAEQMLGLVYEKDLIIAGTCDVFGFLKDGTPIVIDHKTTSALDKESIAWQESILDYMARRLGKEAVNGKPLNWKCALKFFVFHYDKKTHAMTVHELERISDVQIERIFEAEFKGEIYQRPLLVIDAELAIKGEQAEARILVLKQEHDAAVAEAQAFRDLLCAAFETQGIKSWTSPNKLVQISYVPAVSAIQIDSEKLKKEQPALYGKYTKCVPKKAHVRVYDKSKGDK
jgi:hypothetical protein